MDNIEPLDFIRKDNQYESLMRIPDDAYLPIENQLDDYETISEVGSLPFVPPITNVEEFVEYEAARFQGLYSITHDLDEMLASIDTSSQKNKR